MIIAIDGPAGSGKSTVARRIAQHLGFRYIETGSMYRAVAWKARQLGVDAQDKQRVAEIALNLKIEFVPGPDGQRLLADGEDLTGRLQTEIIGRLAATVAANPRVRESLVPKQQAMGRKGDAVMDGRDIGTVVCPEPDHKLFVTADVEVRAERRYKELQGRGTDVIYAQILRDLRTRDERDSRRAVAPLVPADDAFILDTSTLTADEAFERAYAHIVGGGPRRRTRTETI